MEIVLGRQLGANRILDGGHGAWSKEVIESYLFGKAEHNPEK